MDGCHDHTKTLLLNRRRFLLGTGALGLVMTLNPGLVLANAATDERFVFVILRGGMDGLAAVAPYGDPNYAALRGGLALAPDTLLKLDNRFGLHPALAPLYGMYKSSELALIHAAATPYRERSHFDAQNILELGSVKAHALQSGWLNRLIAAIHDRTDPSFALAIGDAVPMVIRGDAKYGSWAPQVLPEVGGDFMSLVSRMYGGDQLFQRTLADGLAVQDMSSDAMKGKDAGEERKKRQAFPSLAKTAGEFLAKAQGPRLATLELGGWDTHVQQGTEAGRLADNFKTLADGLAQLKSALGPVWDKTTVLIVTEFGRTAAVNGNKGTDHGTASVAFLCGGRVKGGIYGGWPGLAQNALYEQRDLMPVTDMRSIMKGVLNDVYGLSPATLDHDIYPGSSGVNPLRGLIRV
ncbi:MAG: DUF1501 domain-containing protein [Pseudobdellovibrionaceae bacterium]